MSVKLPQIIETYVNAANAGDAKTGASCFSDQATVLDEGETLRGKEAIYEWMVKTKKKYNHHSQPLSVKQDVNETIMTAELTGTFDGSPVTLEYHFKIKNNLIEDLRVS